MNEITAHNLYFQNDDLGGWSHFLSWVSVFFSFFPSLEKGSFEMKGGSFEKKSSSMMKEK